MACCKHFGLFPDFCVSCLIEATAAGEIIPPESFEMLNTMLIHVVNQDFPTSEPHDDVLHLARTLGPFCCFCLALCDPWPVMMEIASNALVLVDMLQSRGNHKSVVLDWHNSMFDSLRRAGFKSGLLHVLHHHLPLFSDNEQLSKTLAECATDVEACGQVWRIIKTMLSSNAEFTLFPALQESNVWAQGISQKDECCAWCFHYLADGLNIPELASFPSFCCFFCAAPTEICVSQTVLFLLELQVENNLHPMEVIIDRILFEYQMFPEESLCSLERLIRLKLVPPSVLLLLVATLESMDEVEHRVRVYDALFENQELVGSYAFSSGLLLALGRLGDVEALKLLLHVDGEELFCMQLTADFARQEAHKSLDFQLIVCQIIKSKLGGSEDTLLLAIEVFSELDWMSQDNVELHSVMCTLLEVESYQFVDQQQQFAIHVQQSGYLAHALDNVPILGVVEVKRLLHTVAKNLDLPLPALDELNFALGADTRRHLERIGSEVSLAVVFLLVWDSNQAKISPKWLLPWTASEDVPTSCLPQLMLLLSDTTGPSIELFHHISDTFQSVSPAVQLQVVSQVFAFSRTRHSSVQSRVLRFLCIELKVRCDMALKCGWSCDTLIHVALDESTSFPVFASLMEVDAVRGEVLGGLALQHNQDKWSARKLGLVLPWALTNELWELANRIAVSCVGLDASVWKDALLPATPVCVGLRASLLEATWGEVAQEEPVTVKIAVLGRLCSSNLPEDVKWLCTCVKLRRLTGKEWTSSLVSVLCRAKLDERVRAAQALLDTEDVVVQGVEFQRAFDGACALFTLDKEKVGFSLMAKLAVTSIDSDEAYLGGGLDPNSSLLTLVLTITMNGGTRPVGKHVVECFSRLVREEEWYETSDVVLFLVATSLLVFRLRHDQEVVRRVQLRLDGLIRRTGREAEEDDPQVELLCDAAQSGWTLTKPFARAVLDRVERWCGDSTFRAIAGLSRRLAQSCPRY